jgi:aspartyl-tRNA(Asn)/glutamyl-tRNA(Gln) amidotransferase subunit A
MTRTVMDAALIMNAIAGYDSRDVSSADVPVQDFTAKLGQEISGLRIGLPQEYFYDIIDDEVKNAVYAAAKTFEALGAHVEEVSIPVLEHSIPISSNILITEAAEVHIDHLRHNADDIAPDVRGRLEMGALTPAIEYIKAQRARSVFNRDVSETMKRFDILLAPVNAVGAPLISETMVKVGDREEHKLALMPRLTRPFNLTGSPAVSVPCGFTSSGLPIGMQLAGRAFDESTVLQVAHAYEQATEWHKRRPPI